MHTAEDKFVCHTFTCEPSSGALCKTIEAACKVSVKQQQLMQMCSHNTRLSFIAALSKMPRCTSRKSSLFGIEHTYQGHRRHYQNSNEHIYSKEGQSYLLRASQISTGTFLKHKKKINQHFYCTLCLIGPI